MKCSIDLSIFFFFIIIFFHWKFNNIVISINNKPNEFRSLVKLFFTISKSKKKKSTRSNQTHFSQFTAVKNHWMYPHPSRVTEVFVKKKKKKKKKSARIRGTHYQHLGSNWTSNCLPADNKNSNKSSNPKILRKISNLRNSQSYSIHYMKFEFDIDCFIKPLNDLRNSSKNREASNFMLIILFSK